ncbi:hypothetical protein TWF481_002858 [Arthrobotrys musiformis]|uniref:RNase III domain-containing protein n=1 Tax=Arthrobotrys musiformis TaxID=47236 RepID=A0AAV9VSP2_9PEZI
MAAFNNKSSLIKKSITTFYSRGNCGRIIEVWVADSRFRKNAANNAAMEGWLNCAALSELKALQDSPKTKDGGRKAKEKKKRKKKSKSDNRQSTQSINADTPENEAITDINASSDSSDRVEFSNDDASFSQNNSSKRKYEKSNNPLRGQDFFRRSDMKDAVDLSAMRDKIAADSPLLWNLCKSLVVDPSSEVPDTEKRDSEEVSEVERLALLGITHLLYARNQQMNAFQSLVTFLLYAAGTTKDVIKLLHGLGICIGCSTLTRGVKRLAETTNYVIRDRKKSWIISYDNVNQNIGVSHQTTALGNKSYMDNSTSVVLIEQRGLQPGALIPRN